MRWGKLMCVLLLYRFCGDEANSENLKANVFYFYFYFLVLIRGV